MKLLSIFLILVFFSISSYSQRDVVPFKKDGLWGFMRDTGGIVLEPEYDAIKKEKTNFPYGSNINYYIVQKNNSLAFVTEKGKEILPPIYSSTFKVIKVSPLLIKIKQGGKTIIVNKDGKKEMDDDYDEVITGAYNYLFVRKGKKWGVHQQGKGLILPVTFEGFNPIRGYYRNGGKGYFIFRENNHQGIIDSIGNRILSPIFSEILMINKTIVATRPNEKKSSLFALNGDSLGIYCYSANWFNQDMFRIYMNKTYSSLWDINNRTWVVADSQYHYMEQLGIRGSYILTKIEKSYGLLDIHGKLLLSPKYEQIRSFNENRNIFKYQLKGNNQWGIVAMGDSILHDTIFETIGHFKDSLAVVYKGDKKGVLNYKGELIIPVEYDLIDINKNTIKVFLNHQMTRFTVAPDGSIIKGRQLKNVFTLRAGYSNIYKQRAVRFNPRTPWIPYTQNPNRNNLKIFKENGLKGLKNINTDEIIISPQYQSIIRLNGTDLMICYKRLKTPKVILENIYKTEMQNEQFIFSETKQKYIHPNILGVRFLDFGQSNYAAYLREDGKFGLIGKDGELKKNKDNSPFLATYISAYPSYEQGAKVYIGGRFISMAWMANHPNFIGSMKDIIAPFKINNSNNLTLSKLKITGGLWTYLNSDGEMIAPPSFISAHHFHDSIAICESSKGFGIINIQMDTILPFHFSEIKEYDYRSNTFEVSKKKYRTCLSK